MNKKVVLIILANVMCLWGIVMYVKMEMNIKMQDMQFEMEQKIAHQQKISKDQAAKDYLSRPLANIDHHNKPNKHNTPQVKTKKDQPKTIRYIKPKEYVSKYGPLPDVLTGTQVLGDLVIDENNKLVVTPGIRSVIEYFMSAIGIESLETIAGRIQEYFEQQLPEGAAKEANEIWNSYLIYKNRLAEVETEETLNDLYSSQNAEAIRDVLTRRMILRRRYIRSDVVKAFFEEEEKYDEYNIRCIEINEDKSLSSEEKQSLLVQAEQTLPEDIRQLREQERLNNSLKKQVATLKENGASDEDIYNIRAQTLGEDAAKRWQALDQERENWNNRVDSYFKQKKQILSSPVLNEQTKQQRLLSLKNNSFNEMEQRRLNALERIHQSQ